MAHPELDQALGRLAAARLRTGSAPGLDGPVRPAACPDAETWAAYADGGLAPDEVARLDTHLATCVACRRLVAGLVGAAGTLMPAAAPADERRGVVLPFRSRATWAWMSIAAALLGAVTLWSVTRLDTSAQPDLSTADSRAAGAKLEDERMRPPGPPPAAASAPATPTTATRAPADDARPRAAAPAREPAPLAKEVDRLARVGERRDQAGADRAAAASGGAGSPPREEKAASAVATPDTTRQITLQTNVAPASARPHGPLANQQANQQANAQPVNAAPAVQPVTPAAPPPPPAAKPLEAADAVTPAPAPARPRERAAQTDAAKDGEAKRDAAPAAVSEVVTTTGAGAGRREAAGPRKAASNEGDAGSAAGFRGGLSAATPAFRAVPAFTEPEGRLRWRIAAERTIESSSDGGATWSSRYTSRAERLRAGSAPSIAAAWVVGERGLVLRLVVPGSWTAVSRPATATLVAVSATSADAARVTTDDGRVFVTTDGGQTWVPAPAGPQ